MKGECICGPVAEVERGDRGLVQRFGEGEAQLGTPELRSAEAEPGAVQSLNDEVVACAVLVAVFIVPRVTIVIAEDRKTDAVESGTEFDCRG